jgi:hypothetical protein
MAFHKVLIFPFGVGHFDEVKMSVFEPYVVGGF